MFSQKQHGKIPNCRGNDWEREEAILLSIYHMLSLVDTMGKRYTLSLPSGTLLVSGLGSGGGGDGVGIEYFFLLNL